MEQSDEVREKLAHLAQEKASLLSLWEERRILYEQCMDLQLFYRDTEQVMPSVSLSIMILGFFFLLSLLGCRVF